MSARAVGVFGKLPGRGDFLLRDLDPGFADAWHDWLVRELPAARDQLAEHFEPAYLQAPIWRFAVAPGLAGGQGMTGVMIPSIDAVGRQFPLTLAAAGPIATRDWYAAVEEVAIAALAEDWQSEPWLAQLAALPAPAGAVGDGVHFWGEGSPFVPAGNLTFAGLPTGAAFARLLLERKEPRA